MRWDSNIISQRRQKTVSSQGGEDSADGSATGGEAVLHTGDGGSLTVDDRAEDCQNGRNYSALPSVALVSAHARRIHITQVHDKDPGLVPDGDDIRLQPNCHQKTSLQFRIFADMTRYHRPCPCPRHRTCEPFSRTDNCGPMLPSSALRQPWPEETFVHFLLLFPSELVLCFSALIFDPPTARYTNPCSLREKGVDVDCASIAIFSTGDLVN